MEGSEEQRVGASSDFKPSVDCQCEVCPDDDKNCHCEEAQVKRLYAEFYGNYEDHLRGTKNVGQWGKLPTLLGPKLWTPPWLLLEKPTPLGATVESGTYDAAPESQFGAVDDEQRGKESPSHEGAVMLCKCGEPCYVGFEEKLADLSSLSDIPIVTDTNQHKKYRRKESIAVRDIIQNIILTPNVVLARLDRVVPELTPTFTSLMSFIQIAIKAVGVKIQRHKLRSKLAAMNFSANKKLIRPILNDIFITVLMYSGCCYQIYAKGEEDVRLVPTDNQGPYIVCCTPLSCNLQNLETNSETGTIFSIYKRDLKLSPFSPRTANMSYKYLVSSGYALFASTTKLVMTIGKRIYSFTLDPVAKEFVLTDENMRIPDKGLQISVDEGHSGLWEPQILEYMKRKKDPKLGKPLRTRYVGCLVADFHRILYSGGIYLYPANRKDPQGKTTLLCECVPLAHIADLAGGASSTGKLDVLKTEADQLGQFIPFFVGSKNEVQELLLITSSPARG